MQNVQTLVRVDTKRRTRLSLTDGISIKGSRMRRSGGHGKPSTLLLGTLEEFFFPLPVSSRLLSVARRRKPRTLDPQPARSGRLLQSHTLMERLRGERLGRRGTGVRRGTFSRLSEHPTAAAAVSQTRGRGHPPSGGKKGEQNRGGDRVSGRQRNRARLTGEN